MELIEVITEITQKMIVDEGAAYNGECLIGEQHFKKQRRGQLHNCHDMVVEPVLQLQLRLYRVIRSHVQWQRHRLGQHHKIF